MKPGTNGRRVQLNKICFWIVFSCRWTSAECSTSQVSDFFQSQSHVLLFCAFCGAVLLLFLITCLCCRCTARLKRLPSETGGATLLDVQFSNTSALAQYYHQQHRQYCELSTTECYYQHGEEEDENDPLFYPEAESPLPQVTLNSAAVACQQRRARQRIRLLHPSITRLDMEAAAAAADAPPAYPGTPSPRTLQAIGVNRNSSQTSAPINVMVHAAQSSSQVESMRLTVPTNTTRSSTQQVSPSITPPPSYLDAVHMVVMQSDSHSREQQPAISAIEDSAITDEQPCCPNHEEIMCSQV